MSISSIFLHLKPHFYEKEAGVSNLLEKTMEYTFLKSKVYEINIFVESYLIGKTPKASMVDRSNSVLFKPVLILF